jgi:hypothetical protein
MAYGKAICRLLYSANSDYSYPEMDTGTEYYDPSPTAFEHQYISVDYSAAVTVDLAKYEAVKGIFVRNTDSSNFVTVTWYSTDAAAAASTCEQKLAAGEVMLVPSATIGNDLVLQADTAVVTCEVAILGTVQDYA